MREYWIAIPNTDKSPKRAHTRIVRMRKVTPDANYAAVAAQTPRGHNMLLLDKVDNPSDRFWHTQQVIEGGWSRNILETWRQSKLHKRRAVNNFSCSIFPNN